MGGASPSQYDNLLPSFFCTFLRTEGTKEKDIFNFGKVWIFLFSAIWVTTSLSGMASGVTSALMALTLASFVASAVFIAVSFDREEREENAAAVFRRLGDCAINMGRIWILHEVSLSLLVLPSC